MKNYLSVYDSLREAIVSGGYSFGARLPSKRSVSREKGVSLVTVEHAYRLLCDDGYAVSRLRSGYFVAYRSSDGMTPARAAEPVAFRPRNNRHRLPDKFPFSVFAHTLRGVITRYGERILVKSPNMGTVETREAIAAYLLRRKGLKVCPSQIVIGSGAEYLYCLLAQMFRHSVVAIEDPSYAPIRQAYRAQDVRIRLLRLSANGIASDELKRLRGGVLHVTPYRSYPTGVTADASKRHEYVRWARTRGGILVEDDYDSEFSSDARGGETLFSLDGGERVIYLNTFSKTIAPSLRIGYLVLPKSLLARYAERVGFYSCTVPVFDQLFLADFLNSGAFERHLNRLRRGGDRV